MGKEIKRMNYFDGLLLTAEDYKLDKDYQIRLQGFHNRYLHTWGIAYGLDVKPVIGSEMEVYITEGVALDITDEGNYGSNEIESTSRQILIYDGHPDNPLDLSEYSAGDEIYITVSYYETDADRDNERGQGKEVHIWECGRIKHSKKEVIYDEKTKTEIVKKPDNKKEIILARVVPRAINGSSTGYYETIVDSTCIFYTDTDGTELRQYVGPRAVELGLEQFNFRLNEETTYMPSFSNIFEAKEGGKADEKENHLKIESNMTKFLKDVHVTNNLTLSGTLISRKNGVIDKELEVSEPYLQLNSKKKGYEQYWKVKDGGLSVFRGGPGVAPDARLVWCEKELIWKAGLGNDLRAIGYGDTWNKLVNKDNPLIIDCHCHGKLFSKKGITVNDYDENTISINGELRVNEHEILTKNGGLSWYGEFAKHNVDGPVLSGASNGLIGVSSTNGQKVAISWNDSKYAFNAGNAGNPGNAGIGSFNITADKLDIAESLRLLSGSNPIRFTSQWTGFPDFTTNQAEICNDTTYHKALMIVGNQSAGQGRKVAIWDRLDVNGVLSINGKMQVSQALKLSAGSGYNGIIFPDDPGGGSGDRAWIKYYPRIGEACTLEIGTTNDGDDNISFMPSGNLGVGTMTPNDKLDVFGGMRILNSTNPIRFTSKWSGFPDQASNRAEISNDTTDYKTLMILGNRSGGQGRKVSIWDRLEVNGPTAVTGNLQVKGAIIPGVGNCSVKGIMFPRDPGGGSGDSAWIRYYSDTLRGGGENMTLEIGISNDSNLERVYSREWVITCPWGIPNGCGYWRIIDYYRYGDSGDRLRFRASGGTYIDGNLYYSSTRELKENIEELSSAITKDTLDGLNPVQFSFKGDNNKTTFGFIAEEVPDILSAYDNKAISPMEILTVLVSEVKEQEKALRELEEKVEYL